MSRKPAPHLHYMRSISTSASPYLLVPAGANPYEGCTCRESIPAKAVPAGSQFQPRRYEPPQEEEVGCGWCGTHREPIPSGGRGRLGVVPSAASRLKGPQILHSQRKAGARASWRGSRRLQRGRRSSCKVVPVESEGTVPGRGSPERRAVPGWSCLRRRRRSIGSLKFPTVRSNGVSPADAWS